MVFMGRVTGVNSVAEVKSMSDRIVSLKLLVKVVILNVVSV